MRFRKLIFQQGLLFGILLIFTPSLSLAGTAPQPAMMLQSNNTIADPRAVIIVGHARFTVLTPQLIRMEWAADDHFEDHASFIFLNRRLPVPQFTQHRDGKTLTIDTGSVHVVYHGDSSNNGRFSTKNLSINFTLNGKRVIWHPGAPDDGNLQGTARTLDQALGSHLHAPMEPGLISRDGWTVVDDSHRPLFDSDNFSFTSGENSPWPWVMLRPAGDRLDWYFFGYGHDYKQAMHDYVRVAGRIPLPPRYAFGAWWSRYWAYSDQELNSLVRGFHENDVPLDVLVIDMDWHLSQSQLEAMHDTDQSGQKLGWTGYTWNPLLFPDPAAFLERMHDEGLKVTLNLHPASGVQPWEKTYPAMARTMGIDPATKNYVPFDIASKKFAQNYMDILHHPLEKQGINFWWLDWQQGDKTSLPGVNPTWWLNYVHFIDQAREGKRPLLFGRWGGLGNHRYEIGFSGDTISVWESLAFQPWFTATAANVGYAYWSHDIGGHMPGVVDPELYTRWVQFGAFSPILRTHTTKNPDAERRIWTYPEPYSGIMRDAYHLRYALQPYLYTEARRTYDSGVAFLHPLYYDWPEAESAYAEKDEYVFGSQMIVAPVTRPADPITKLASQNVWIPEGDWIEVPTGRHFAGPEQLTRQFSIDQIPVYVRAGAIVPMQPPMEYTGQKPVDPLILNIYPLADGQSSAYTLYEDNSKGEEYKRNICAWTTIHATQRSDGLTVEIDPVKGSYPGMLTERSYEVRLPADWPPESVVVNGNSLRFAGMDENKPGWRYDGNKLETIVITPHFSVHSRLRLVVRRAKGSLDSRIELNGFSGAMERLRSVYDELNNLHPVVWSPNPLIEVMQTGDRLSYRPQTIRAEMGAFSQRYQQGVDAVRQLVGVVQQRLLAHASSAAATANDKHAITQIQAELQVLKDGEPSVYAGQKDRIPK